MKFPGNKTEEKNMGTKMFFAVACGLALAGSGCVSVKIGPPTVQTAEYKSETVTQGVLGMEAAEAGPALEQNGLALRLGLQGRAKVLEGRADIYRELIVTKQRKMSFGFLPGMAEGAYATPDELVPLIGFDMFESEKEFKPYAGMAGMVVREGGKIYARAPLNLEVLLGMAWTPVALFVTPFWGDWEPQTYHWYRGDQGRWDTGVFNKLKREDRERMRLNTCPVSSWKSYTTHLAWLGFHRFETLELGDRFARNEPFTVTNLTGTLAVRGPYEVEVEIPSIGYKRRQLVSPGDTAETFFLPASSETGEAEASIRFFAAEGETGERDRDEQAILDAALGRTYTETIRLARENGK